MGIYLLVLDSFGGGSGGGGTVSPPPPMGAVDEPWLLLASVVMCALSFFLLHQAVEFQKWVTAKDKSAPNPWAGVGLACGLAIGMVLFSLLYWRVRHGAPDSELSGRDSFLWFISNRPSELAVGPLLGSIVPYAMAIFKFVMASFIMRDTDQESPPLSRSPRAALAGAILTLISLLGSIAGLIRFFFWIKDPINGP